MFNATTFLLQRPDQNILFEELLSIFLKLLGILFENTAGVNTN